LSRVLFSNEVFEEVTGLGIEGIAMNPLILQWADLQAKKLGYAFPYVGACHTCLLAVATTEHNIFCPTCAKLIVTFN